MNDVNYRHDDEIDLIELFNTLWAKKILIAAVTAVFSIIALVYVSITPSTFTAQTIFRPIPLLENLKYRSFNQYDAVEVNSNTLFVMFLEQLQSSDAIQAAMKELNFIDSSLYDAEAEYNLALAQEASEVGVKIIKNTNIVTAEEPSIYLELSYSHTDEEKWKQLLALLYSQVNTDIRKTIISRVESIVASERSKLNFEIEDIATAIENAERDYEQFVLTRIAYLEEHAAIARYLNLAEGRMVSGDKVNFEISNDVLMNLNSNDAMTPEKTNNFEANRSSQNHADDTITYLRGYKAIEKEIELLKNRKNKSYFIEGLFQLEQQKRALEQDKTLERIQAALLETPIADEAEFHSVLANVDATEFNYSKKKIMILVLAIFLGLMSSCIFVLFRSAVQNKAEQH
ncbi:Wzz/FepE/Etk N-terminal domain-containing protein [Reinekea thalattae]|uniref:Polysaccharide chain length determinant N-terminal domain-containing protein n=1 Tax=Reinekea thalattae TaxID=2593301 RepID=A0A5C8Z5S6_9GAMM|nr:Wzz/FepE/Etk N-terminal domain-containing protein [Reinekea thalattae]TXR53322.1 hypothetical protein FME95_01755 [Reinekea thalattae]